MLVFPEGSRTLDGELHEMLPGTSLLARRSRATIVPLALEGAFQALPRGAVFVRPHSIRLTFGPAITPQQYEQLSDEQLTALINQRIEQVFAATRDELSTDSYADNNRREKRANSLLA